MTSSRAAGWPLLVGAALLFLAQIPQSVLFGGDDTARYAQQALWVPTSLVSVAGAILLLWGLPILYANARARGLGWMGGVGSFLIFIGGSMFGIFFSLLSVIFLPYLVTRVPNILSDSAPAGLFPFFLIATIALILGSILLAVPLVRGKAFSRWPGYVLLVSAAAGIVGFFLTGPGNTSLVGIIVEGVNSFLLFAGLGWLGYEMITMPRAEEALSS
ncbi:MAG TPA: hypothetical protein VFA92_09210 [Candidatus Binatia bacterium]|jgi:hypothetical protein|nr:hypothetical protein [Candidatus Binatia bacterium]